MGYNPLQIVPALLLSELISGLAAAFFTYFIFTNHTIDWELAPFLIAGAVISVPFAAYTVKRFKSSRLKLIVGVAIVMLGLFTLGKLFL